MNSLQRAVNRSPWKRQYAFYPLLMASRIRPGIFLPCWWRLLLVYPGAHAPPSPPYPCALAFIGLTVTMLTGTLGTGKALEGFASGSIWVIVAVIYICSRYGFACMAAHVAGHVRRFSRYWQRPGVPGDLLAPLRTYSGCLGYSLAYYSAGPGPIFMVPGLLICLPGGRSAS